METRMDNDVADRGGTLCPIAGVVAMPIMGPPRDGRVLRSVDEGQMTIQHQLIGCVEKECKLWSAAGQNCVLRLGAEAQIALSKQLADALKMAALFAGKK